MAGCDGVHVGQDDLPVSDVRRFAPELRVGVSTHNEEQLEAALALNVDYVAFGPVFATKSKAQPDPTVGLDGLERAARAARARACPLVAIGGIDLDNAGSVAAHADLGAVISALWADDEGLDGVTARAKALASALFK
jgi:thiamine-phosphate pyrophosphorylase